MKNSIPALCLVTDTCWPATGGVETWVHAHSAHFCRGAQGAQGAKKFTVSVVAHAQKNTAGGMLSRTVLLKPFAPFHDDSGSPVSCLAPSFIGRILMLPFCIWYLPLIKRLWPKPVFDFLYLFYRLAFFRRLAAAVAHADIVHCFSTGYLAVCVTEVCRKRGIRLIHSPPAHFGKWGDSPLLMSAYAQADAVCCLSQAFKTEFKRLAAPPLPRVEVVPALTIEHTSSRRPDLAVSAPFILFLGRREKHKGLDLLISACGKISPHVTLAIAGPGPKAASATRPWIVDFGEVEPDGKQWLLEHCDVFCVPSSEESFGIVYTEAMRCAKPVVALDIAPVNEIVRNGETGLLVRQADPDKLAAALSRCLADDTLRSTLGKNGRNRYEETYSPGVILRQTVAMYESVL